MTKPTKAQEIQRALSDDIVRGRLSPGSTLDETGLAGQFGVSRTPIREAIRQLEAAGLVSGRPHIGAVVTDIPAARLDDMFQVMAELEALCARWSALAMTPAERQGLRDLHEASSVLVREGRREAYVGANDRFHGAIYEGSHSPFLAETTRHVRLRLAPFRRVQFEGPTRLARSFAEHERITTAIERADGGMAETEMRLHLAVVRGAVDEVRSDASAPRNHRAE